MWDAVINTHEASIKYLNSEIVGLLPRREPFQKFSKAQDKLRPRRGFGNSFQPAIDAPRLVPH
ncbi:unnamed protein product [Brassica rapa]|uniref:Uncharacterized protein n=1 Tax=Brassica campestris TaxID=3711 RepID=A0A3P6AXR4_BRACM|nr:unnamed protein product [Brassica rapa]VDC88838.1 unnamed protein product [Brassica rapa]